MPVTSDSHAYRACLLWFPDANSDQIHFEADGLLVTTRGADGVSRISAIGDYRSLQAAHAHLPTTDWRGRWIDQLHRVPGAGQVVGKLAADQPGAHDQYPGLGRLGRTLSQQSGVEG